MIYEVIPSYVSPTQPSQFVKIKNNIHMIAVKYIFKDFFIFREKGRREGEKHQCVVASHAPPTGDLVHNPTMCPD